MGKKKDDRCDPSGSWGHRAVLLIQLLTQLAALGLAIWKGSGR